MENNKKRIEVADIRLIKKEKVDEPVKAADRLGEMDTSAILKFEKSQPPNKPLRRSTRPTAFRITIFLIAAAIVVFSFWAYGGWFFKKHLREVSVTTAGELQSAISDFRHLRPDAAQQKLQLIAQDPNLAVGNFIAKFWPSLKNSAGILAKFENLMANSATLAQETKFLQDNVLSFALNGKGDELLGRLEKISSILDQINGGREDIAGTAAESNDTAPILPPLFLSFQAEVDRFQKFLDLLLDWLGNGNVRHLALMLQNPSEIRPAGGFLGSYADLSIAGGNLEEIKVRDINEADRSLSLKTVPPKPLQAIVTNWRAADANWFFDFSESAQKVLKFLEASDIYRNSSSTFDGAIAVSPKVVSDVLSLTGPIKIGDSVFNKDNFLVEIQKQVQAGQETKAVYPKKILEQLVPVIIRKLANLDDPETKIFFSMAGNWLANKELMFYFKNQNFEEFFDGYGFTGKIYDLPRDFEGDYLAIVDANVGGGKTDIFVKQKVTFQSQIGSDGIVSNRLTVERKHNGADGKFWWYKVPNIDHFQIFTPPGSRLMDQSGGLKKEIKPPINYIKNGYVADPLVARIESSTQTLLDYPAVENYEDSGKEIYATWSKIRVGETAKLVFSYIHRLYLPPKGGQIYQFVFEKQSGTNRDYHFEFSAPEGFRFKENGLPVFEYDTNDPLGRLILNLTLQKI